MADQERSFSTTSPHFFAIILERTLLSKKLKIPNKIVRKCGSSLGDDVLLKLPCGSKWKLGLTKSSEGKVYVDKGWLEFSKHYSIEKGHLLVLRYDGNSQFSVVIFDTTTKEIDYPLKNRNESETQNRDKRVKEEEEEEEEEEIENGRDEDYNPSRPRKKMRNSCFDGKFSNLGGEGANSQRSEGLARPDSSSRAMERKRKKALALERASGFKSKHPFFVLFIQPSNIAANYCMNVPRAFARSHLGKNNNRVVLRVEDGRDWLVEYKTDTDRRKCTWSRFVGGWLSFARGNGLKCGDVCIFVMTKTIPSVSFEVSFFRKNGVTNSSSVPGKPTNESVHAAKRKASGFDGRFQTENPSFAVCMNTTYIKNGCCLRIPANFARTYMNENQREIRFFVLDGRSWSVEYRIFRSRNVKRYQICNGWSKFKRESGLEEGDICTFELTNKYDNSFKVRIVKPIHEGYEKMRKALLASRTKPSHPQKDSKARTSLRLPSKFGEVKFEEAYKFCTENPYFRVDFSSIDLNKRHLKLPVTFGRRYLEKKTQSVTLQAGENSWPVKLRFSLPAIYSFSGGWSAFRSENSLHPRDVCIFELIKTNQAVFKVSIFHETC